MRDTFFARRYFVFLLAIVFVLPFITRGARLAVQGNNNDIKDWLPPSYAESTRLKWFQSHFAGEQFALVSWDGCTLGDTQKLELLAAKLVPDDRTSGRGSNSKLFSRVITGPEMLAQMTRPPLELSRVEAIRRLEGSLIGPDLTGEGDAGRATCLIVTLSEVGKRDNRNKRLAIEQIEQAAQECAIPLSALRLGGPPVDNVAIDIEGLTTLYRLAGLSGLVGLSVSYWCFRSWRLTWMVFAVGVLSAGLSLASVYYFGLIERLLSGELRARFGSVDAVLLSMPALVYVMGLSGAIHIVNYFRDAVREHGWHGAIERAVVHSWVPCSLCALTTAVGLASLNTSDILPIRKFGIFSALGVLGTLSLLFTLLPAAIYRFAPRRGGPSLQKGTQQGHTAEWDEDSRRAVDASVKLRSDAMLHPLWHGVCQWIIRRNALVFAAWGSMMVLFAVGLTKIDTTVQLLKLFDEDADIIDDYRWLETNLGNLVPMEIVLQFPPESVRGGDDDAEEGGVGYRMNLLERMELVQRVEQRVEELEHVGRALSVATFAPEFRSSGTRLVDTGQRFAINRQLEKHYEEQLLSSDYLSEELREASLAEDGPWPSQGSRQLWRISARVAALADVDYGRFVGEIRGRVEPVLLAYRQRDAILSALRADGRKLRRSRIVLILDESEIAASSEARGAAELLQGLLVEAGAKVQPLSQEAVRRLARQVTDGIERGASADGASPSVGDPLARIASTADILVLTSSDQLASASHLAESGLQTVDISQPLDSMPPLGPAVSAKYTGIVPLVYKTQRQLLLSLRQSIGWAFVMIAVLMMVILRSVTAGLLAMIPNVFPLVLIFGALGWLGIKVDIGIMMTASVALGVAVDDTIHFLFWVRRGLELGHSRQSAVMLAYERCSRAMFQTTVIGGLGLAVFAFSTFTPTQQFGVLMISLLSAALVGDLLFLPAIIAGPWGKSFGRSVRKSAGVQPREVRAEFDEPEVSPRRPHDRAQRIRHDSPHRSRRAS
jgi:predicted RND superfamily exporter protein